MPERAAGLMSILYLLTAPRPPIDGTDAVHNEVAALQAAFGGETMNLFPLALPSSRFPKSLYGLHAITALRRTEARHRANHVYFSILRWFPVFSLLRKPIIYTVSASLDGRRRPRSLAKLKTLHRIVVSNDRDAAILRSWDLLSHEVIPPGIDTSGVSRQPLGLEGDLTLLMASAPWHLRQFCLKGIDALLEAAAMLPYLRLVLLWRGLFVAELTDRVSRLGLQNRVEIVNHKVDINAHLARAHATILLAEHGDIVKAYPHSLIESLVAGKPVLVSGNSPMGDYVRQHGCGVVVTRVSVSDVVDAVEMLKRDYASLVRRTAAITSDAFSVQALIERHQQMYGDFVQQPRCL